MKRLWWLLGGSAAAVAAAGATIAAAASLGPVTSNDLTTAAGVSAPGFAIRDTFTAADGTPLNGRSLELDPSGSLSAFGLVDAPVWTAPADWTIEGNGAERTSGSGTTTAHVPFTAQDGYVRVVWTTMTNRPQSAGVALCYDPSSTSGIVLSALRERGRWYFELGTMSGGTFTATDSVEVASPQGTEFRLTINGSNAVASYGGIDQFSLAITGSNCLGTGVAMVSFTTESPVFDDFLAVKTG